MAHLTCDESNAVVKCSMIRRLAPAVPRRYIPRKMEPQYAALTLDQVPAKDRKLSRDGKRVAAWFISRRSEDRYDCDTDYQVAVWNARTREAVAVFLRSYDISHYTHSSTGKPVSRIDFTPDSKAIVIGYEDGSLEKVSVEAAATGTQARDAPDVRLCWNAGHWSVVVGGRKGEPFDNVDALTWSPDGERLAYAAQSSGHWFVVEGDRKGKPFDDVHRLTWSPDGKTPAYVAMLGAESFVVVGTRKIGPFAYFSSALSWSPDGKRLTVVAESEGTWLKFVVNRKGAIEKREKFLTPPA